MSEKAKGKAKEAYGALTGDEALKAEGRAEQRKAEAEAEARQREKTRLAEAEARQAEKERDRQRLKDEGPLGGVTRGGGPGRADRKAARPLGGAPTVAKEATTASSRRRGKERSWACWAAGAARKTRMRGPWTGPRAGSKKPAARLRATRN